MNRSTAQTTEATLAQIHDLPWVETTDETDRDDSTHRIVTNQSLVRTNVELHTLENIGVHPRAISQEGHYGVHLYVKIS